GKQVALVCREDVPERRIFLRIFSADGADKAKLSFEKEARCIAFSNDGKAVAAASRSMIFLLDLSKGQIVSRIPIEARKILFSPDDKILGILGDRFYLWDLENVKELATQAPPLGALAVSPDSTLLASARPNDSSVICLWDLDSKTPALQIDSQ